MSPRRHNAITPSDTVNCDPMLSGLICVAAGTVQVMDEAGIVLPYTLAVNEVLPFGPTRVMATGTTGTYYGWK